MPPRKRFYAILRGRETGVFNSWQEVEVHVKGFRGAIYQSFGNWDDAQAYLNSAISITDNTPTPPSPTPPSFSDPINDPGVEQSTNIHGLFDTKVSATGTMRKLTSTLQFQSRTTRQHPLRLPHRLFRIRSMTLASNKAPTYMDYLIPTSLLRFPRIVQEPR